MIWITLLRSKLARYGGAALAIILAVLTFGALQRRKGRNAEKAKAMEARVKAAATSKEVKDEIQGMDDSRVSSELGRWMRDDDRD